MVDSGLSYTGSTSALGADRLGSIPSSPTNLNIANFAGSLFARSPRLWRGFARIFPYISAQNQTDGQNQKSVFCPAGGGSFQFFPQMI